MRDRVGRWLWTVVLAGLGGWLLQAGCIRTLQQEIEILTQPEASLNQVYDSVLVDLFGPQILKFW